MLLWISDQHRRYVVNHFSQAWLMPGYHQRGSSLKAYERKHSDQTYYIVLRQMDLHSIILIYEAQNSL